MDTPRVIQEIQYAIVPAVMVSSSALLLLGFHNKLSNLANRFRVLNAEKRVLVHKADKDAPDKARLENLKSQTYELFERASYVKNAILCVYGGILCFAGASILIFLNFYTAYLLGSLTTVVFMAGFVFLLSATILMILETSLFYKILLLEKNI